MVVFKCVTVGKAAPQNVWGFLMVLGSFPVVCGCFLSRVVGANDDEHHRATVYTEPSLVWLAAWLFCCCWVRFRLLWSVNVWCVFAALSLWPECFCNFSSSAAALSFSVCKKEEVSSKHSNNQARRSIDLIYSFGFDSVILLLAAPRIAQSGDFYQIKNTKSVCLSVWSIWKHISQSGIAKIELLQWPVVVCSWMMATTIKHWVCQQHG